jgi:hypothetical protein
MTDVQAKVEEAPGVGQSNVAPGDCGKGRIQDKKAIIRWLWTLASTIAKCNDCAAMISPTYVHVPYAEAEVRIRRLERELLSVKRLVAHFGQGEYEIHHIEEEIRLLHKGLAVGGANTYTFVGVESDRQVVVDLYRYMAALCWELAEKEGRAQREDIRKEIINNLGKCEPGNLSAKVHEFRHAFCQGFSDAVCKRFEEQREAMLVAARAAQNTCNALMVVDRRALMVKGWMDEKTHPMYGGSYSRGSNQEAYALGAAVGSQVGLSGKVLA